MSIPARYAEVRPWWHRRRQFSLAELIADGIVHGIGIVFALSLGTVLIVFAAIGTARSELPAIIVYLVTLLTVLGVSLAFNLAPVSGHWSPLSPDYLLSPSRSPIMGKNRATTIVPMMPPRQTIMSGSNRLIRLLTAVSTSSS